MEKHNVIEQDRTPGFEKNAADTGDSMFAEAAGMFDKDAMLQRGKSAAHACKCPECKCAKHKE